MAICEITGKGKLYGHHVSFSQHKTPKVFRPNVHKRTLILNGRKVRVNISTSALRTLRKKGLIDPPKPSATPKSSSPTTPKTPTSNTSQKTPPKTTAPQTTTPETTAPQTTPPNPSQ